MQTEQMYIPKFGKVVKVNASDVESWRAQGGMLESEMNGQSAEQIEAERDKAAKAAEKEAAEAKAAEAKTEADKAAKADKSDKPDKPSK